MKYFIIRGMVLSLAFLLVFSTLAPLQAAENSAAVKKININSATLVELQDLPSIGVKIAQRIIDFRKKNGNFKRIEEIMKVKGIGEKTFLRFKNLITTGMSSASKK
jgi:competence protein ComEA